MVICVSLLFMVVTQGFTSGSPWGATQGYPSARQDLKKPSSQAEVSTQDSEGQVDRFHYDPCVREASRSFRTKIANKLPSTFDLKKFVQSIKKVHPNTNIKKPLYGSFVFGQLGTKRVILLIDEIHKNELFADLDRDGKFSKKERFLAKTPGRWVLPVPARFLGTKSKQTNRVVIHWNDSLGYFESATTGGMVGQVQVNQVVHRVLLLDCNANGQWMDFEDRFLLDLNRDGKLDPITERYACRDVVLLHNQRYTIESDMQGKFFRMKLLKHSGSFIPKIKLGKSSFTIRKFQAQLASSSGIHLKVTDLGKPVEAPIGKYTVKQVFFEIHSEKGIQSYGFARSGQKPVTLEIKKDQTTDFHLLGELNLSTDYSVLSERGGKTIVINPELRTETGLFLVGCSQGKISPDQEVQLESVTTRDGNEIDLSASGFS